MVVAVLVGMIRLVRSHMWPTNRLYGVSHIPRRYVIGMARSLIRLIVNAITYDTPLGVYSYKQILFIADYNSSIEVKESFKYPLDHLESRLKLEK